MAIVDEKASEDAQAREVTDVPSDKYGSDEEFNITWTEKEEKRVRNKLDWQIVRTSNAQNRSTPRLTNLAGTNGDRAVLDVLPGSVCHRMMLHLANGTPNV